MRKQAMEERILGLIMGIGLGTILGFMLRSSDDRQGPRKTPVPVAPAI